MCLTSFAYTKLLSTIPLDILLAKLNHKELADRLTYSCSHIVGLGLRLWTGICHPVLHHNYWSLSCSQNINMIAKRCAILMLIPKMTTKGTNLQGDKSRMWYPDRGCHNYCCIVFSQCSIGNAPTPNKQLPTLLYGNFLSVFTCVVVLWLKYK